MARVGSVPPYASLETSVEEARLSFACTFSSSEEFEAALIKRRREAGHYGPRRRPHSVVGVVIAGALLIAICFAAF